MKRVVLPELVSIYGYMPNFHDALLLQVKMREATLSVDFLVRDLSKLSEGDINTRLVMDFHGVKRARIFISDNWIDSLTLEENGNQYLTSFADQNSQKMSEIVSQDFVVRSATVVDEAYHSRPETDTCELDLF